MWYQKNKTMSKRINIPEVAPEAYKALAHLDHKVASSGLDPIHKELIKIRASQINGCAFCVDMHTRDARNLGESERRIYAISVWRDTPFFTPEERAILALTEELTLIQQRVSDETYQQAAALFSEQYLGLLFMAIITINAWNRVGVGTELQPAL